MMYPTSHILYRMVRVQTSKCIGSGVIFHEGDCVYLLTAAHVIEGIQASSELRLDLRHHSGEFTVLDLECLADVAVVKLEMTYPIEKFAVLLDDESVIFGQDIYLIGFPLGWKMTVQTEHKRELNPFVKRAVFSNWGDGDQRYADTAVNKGFSGGPVVYFCQGETVPRIFGIISANCKQPDGFSLFYRAGLARFGIEAISARAAVTK